MAGIPYEAVKRRFVAVETGEVVTHVRGLEKLLAVSSAQRNKARSNGTEG